MFQPNFDPKPNININFFYANIKILWNLYYVRRILSMISRIYEIVYFRQ